MPSRGLYFFSFSESVTGSVPSLPMNLLANWCTWLFALATGAGGRCRPVDRGSFEPRSAAPAVLPASGFLSGGIGLHARWVIVTWGCGLTMASFGGAPWRLLRQLGAVVGAEGCGGGGRLSPMTQPSIAGGADVSMAMPATVSKDLEEVLELEGEED